MKGFVPILCVLILSGCQSGLTSKANPGRTDASGGIRIASFNDLKPDSYNDARATVELGGMKIPTTVKITRSPNKVVIDLLSADEVIDSETYEFDDNLFGLSATLDETYSPLLPLVKFPMRVGEEPWDWKGTLTSGGVKRTATASISSKSEPLFLPGISSESVIKVEVRLSIDAGAPDPAQKVLTFWFAPDHGVVKRSFGHALTRTPAESDP